MAKIRNKYGAGTLPSSKGEVTERSGIENDGYINKKDTPSGINAGFNDLPPGQNIEDQTCADIRSMPMKNPTVMGYEGDDWHSPGGVWRKDVTVRKATNIDLPLAGGDEEMK